MTECGNDSLKYIEMNYEDNSNRYIGKTIKMFIDECELTFNHFYKGISGPLGGNKSLEGIITDLNFAKYYQSYEYVITVELEFPQKYSVEETRPLEEIKYGLWNQALYNYFKDAVIKSFYIYKGQNGEIIKNYRRP